MDAEVQIKGDGTIDPNSIKDLKAGDLKGEAALAGPRPYAIELSPSAMAQLHFVLDRDRYGSDLAFVDALGTEALQQRIDEGALSPLHEVVFVGGVGPELIWGVQCRDDAALAALGDTSSFEVHIRTLDV